MLEYKNGRLRSLPDRLNPKLFGIIPVSLMIFKQFLMDIKQPIKIVMLK